MAIIFNAFTTALRSILNNKIFSLIKVTGLAISICACIVVYLVVSFEFSFDAFHPEGDQVYRLILEIEEGTGEKYSWTSASVPFAEVIRSEVTGIEAVAQLHMMHAEITVQGKGTVKEFKSREEGGSLPSIIITSPEYFEIFSFKWLAGTPRSLSDPNKVIISEELARKYFGTGSLDKFIGRELIYNNGDFVLTVSGIVEDWAKNTDLPFNQFISLRTVKNGPLKERFALENWYSYPKTTKTFLKVNKNASVEGIKAQLNRIIKNHSVEGVQQKLTASLQPLNKMHFTNDSSGDTTASKYDGDDFRKAHLRTLILSAIGAFLVLVIACVNFINLTTAQAIKRSKEVGVRKVLGSSKLSLIMLFLAETFILTCFSFFIAILLVDPALSIFQLYIPAGVLFEINLINISFILFVFFLTVIIAGLYPAKVLSSASPILSLKGGTEPHVGKWYFRKALIVFQFAISLIFIIATIVIDTQVEFLQNRSKGLETSDIVSFWCPSVASVRVLADRLSGVNGVETVALQRFSPIGYARMINMAYFKGKSHIETAVSLKPADEGFIPFYEITIVAGSNLSANDSLKELVINEYLSKSLGFKEPDEAVGQLISLNGRDHTIVGVVADFNEGSFHSAIGPIAIVNDPLSLRNIAVKLKPSKDSKEVLDQIKDEWVQVYPNDEFNPVFLEDVITEFYSHETQTAKVMNRASIVTIVISCLGIFGLTLFAARIKTKEVAIRKILGASPMRIAIHLSKELIVLILLAVLVASPIAWYLMNNWLITFPYRTNISWTVFVFSAVITLSIGLMTIMSQIIKVALANPVKSIKSE